VVHDSSGRNLHAHFTSQPPHSQGVINRAAVFHGGRYAEAGPANALRLAGSMTIAAWIKSTSFPGDYAAIVSQLDHDLGYQLDTTVDRGPRTIGFKLTNAHGDLMIRYGRTSLVLNTWYHVAGVYDAGARTLDVYLNGQQDNGPLAGLVTGSQHSSRAAVYLGTRADARGFEFSGLMDDVRIYSLALTKGEIAAVMHGSVVDRAIGEDANVSSSARRHNDLPTPCTASAEPYDIELPLAAAAAGVLAAIACVGLKPATTSAMVILGSAVTGSLLLGVSWSDLPLFDRVCVPLTSTAGGVSVLFSKRFSKGC